MTGCQKSCGCDVADTSPMQRINPLPADATATVSLFAIPKMDCPAEERLIRIALESVEDLAALEFDLSQRELRVVHAGAVEPIALRLEKLGLGSRLVSSALTTQEIPSAPLPSAAQEAQILQWLLGINAVMFVVEIISGWRAESTGLIADSLDMFADATVYGLALYAVGRHAAAKLSAARLSGWLQLLLACGAMVEVLRRFVFGSEPEAPLMMGVALVALLANLTCLLLLARHRNGSVHMKASWIFSTNDVLANLGVIVAGMLVAWSGTNYPDLIIGTLIALLVLNGARRILRLQG